MATLCDNNMLGSKLTIDGRGRSIRSSYRKAKALRVKRALEIVVNEKITTKELKIPIKMSARSIKNKRTKQIEDDALKQLIYQNIIEVRDPADYPAENDADDHMQDSEWTINDFIDVDEVISEPLLGTRWTTDDQGRDIRSSYRPRIRINYRV